MYESFYGLRERPFELVPNPKYLFLSGRQREALSNLRLGLTTARGLTLLIGDAGTGKTTLVQAILEELRSSQVESVLISNPTLKRDEFYEYLATAFRLPEAARSSKTQFLLEFRAHLDRRADAGLLTALIVDEAQSLPYDLLEEIRLLSNIETQTKKLVNVVLAGQPELSGRLNDPNLRQLKQRISLRCELTVFDFAETAAYIAGRLRIAGGNPVEIFSREAVHAIFEASRGVPRLVNVVCDNALIGGFAANTRPILRAVVQEVCRDFDLNDEGAAVSQQPPTAENLRADRVIETPEPARVIAPIADAEVDSVAEADSAVSAGGRKRRFSFF